MGQIDPVLREKLLIVIPVYNHEHTLRTVTEKALQTGFNVLVVDDGSSKPVSPVLQGLGVKIIRHSQNKGKGKAILSAARYARKKGWTHLATLDADGQHLPEELFKLLPEMQADPLAIIIGARLFPEKNVPASSRFGRSFSNFWLRVQTGVIVSDVQSGFRIYPLELLSTLKFNQSGYAFEVEVLIRSLWAGFNIREAKIEVYYPEPGQRISHFNKFRDNLRLSLLNTRLTARAVLPWPHKKYAADQNQKVTPLHPLKSLRLLLEKKNTPLMLALSGALGVFVGSFPIFGLHSITVVLVSGFFGLNKIAALACNQLCMPPVVPALCIETGYFLRHGEFLTEISLRTLGYECVSRLWEWLLGALVLGPILGLSIGAIIFILGKGIQRRLQQ